MVTTSQLSLADQAVSLYSLIFKDWWAFYSVRNDLRINTTYVIPSQVHYSICDFPFSTYHLAIF